MKKADEIVQCKTMKLIVFTDLDGTLLDHETYSFTPALTALDRLKRHECPIIITTSKTWAEVAPLQKALDICDPCIVENGSALYRGNSAFSEALYDQSEKIFGRSYKDICLFINQLPPDLRQKMVGFADMTTDDVVNATGLSAENASKAKQRLASEPFLWSGSSDELANLRNHIEEAGLGLVQGGRFYHLLSKVDKSLAIKWLMERAIKTFRGQDFHTCALGDGPNDIEMIRQADTGVVIANSKGISLSIGNPHGKLVYTVEEGPKGWNKALNSLMEELGLD